jgi:hypothetical protein
MVFDFSDLTEPTEPVEMARPKPVRKPRSRFGSGLAPRILRGLFPGREIADHATDIRACARRRQGHDGRRVEPAPSRRPRAQSRTARVGAYGGGSAFRPHARWQAATGGIRKGTRDYRARSCESVRPRAPTSTTTIGRVGGDSRAVRSFAVPGVDSGAAGIALPTAMPLRRSRFAHSGLMSPSARRSAALRFRASTASLRFGNP